MIRKFNGRHSWSEEEYAYLTEICYGRTIKEIRQMMADKFPEYYSHGSIQTAMRRKHLFTGNSGRWQKGHIPMNKGMKGVAYPGSEKGFFPKGHTADNSLPIGTIRTRGDGYRYIKWQDKKGNLNWMKVARWNWEKVHGPVPKRHKLVNVSGDVTNESEGNYVLVTNEEMATLNRWIKLGDDEELNRVAITNAKLKQLIGRLKHEIAENRRQSVRGN